MVDRSRTGLGRDRLEADGTWIDDVEKEDISTRPTITTRDSGSWSARFSEIMRAAFGWTER